MRSRRSQPAFLLALLCGCTIVVDERVQTPTCLSDAECPTLDVCAGPRVCDAMTHECVSQNTPLDCDDGEPCTADVCDPATVDGCVNTFIDADGDGYSPQTCATPAYATNGDDCNDGNNLINTAATEQCTTVEDDDCDGATDDYTGDITCFRDADMDGFHNAFDSVPASGGGCGCPAGYIPPNVNGSDCADGIANARPGSTYVSTDPFCVSGVVNGKAEFSKPADSSGPTGVCNADANGSYNRSWDYNCDGNSTQTLTSAGSTCSCFTDPSFASAAQPIDADASIAKGACSMCQPRWNGSVPSCGASGNLWTCSGGTFVNRTYCDDAPSAYYPSCR